MNDEWESYCTWTGSLVEAISKFTYDAGNLFVDFFVLTSNAANSVLESSESYASLILKVFQSIIDYLAFDDFQLKLLKIILSLLLTVIFLIYITWHIYGERIGERFVLQNKAEAEQIKRSVLNLKLPKEHSQQFG